ncbi:hypothetical protein CYY_001340 [Polysphondylium violaceum]|uniref:Mitochondrial import inner membrane translocase subunit Tim21 n=1 Tax=Polysphondylium violaceum TaxID=133409 RepID=A0A8J4Q391_9MYCE|nr:hypothetical protein CYY_001340 [Polysphondylium violaceum]
MFKHPISRYITLTCNNINTIKYKINSPTPITLNNKHPFSISCFYRGVTSNNNSNNSNIFLNRRIKSNDGNIDAFLLSSSNNSIFNNNCNTSRVYLQAQPQQQQFYEKRYYGNQKKYRSLDFANSAISIIGLGGIIGILYIFLSQFVELIPFEIISTQVEKLLRDNDKVNNLLGPQFFFDSFPLSQQNKVDKKGDKEYLNTSYLIRSPEGQATVECKAWKKDFLTYEIVSLKVFYGSYVVITVVGEQPIITSFWNKMVGFFSHPSNQDDKK